MYYCINGTWVCKVHTYVVHSLLWFNIGTSPYTCKKLIYVLVIWASLRFFSPEQDHATQDCICCGYCGGVGDHCSPDIWYCQDQTSRRQQRLMTNHWGWLTLTSCTFICCLNTVYFSSHISAECICMHVNEYVRTCTHFLMAVGIHICYIYIPVCGYV